jgi:glyoxalase family protein
VLSASLVISLISENQLEGIVTGLHHITLVTSNQVVNNRFYTEVLGLRRVKLTVNQDDVLHRHIFYADEKGSTGSAITFFEWPELPRGQVGLGSPHHIAYTAPGVDSLVKWKSWLVSQGVSVTGPYSRDGRVSLYLSDPDGVTVEITTADPRDEITQEYLNEKERNPSSVSAISHDMRLVRFNHATPISNDAKLTSLFFDKLLGLRNAIAKPNPDQEGTTILEVGSDDRPDFMRYIVSEDASLGFVGKGNVHHIAMAVEDDESQIKIMRHLNDIGIQNSGVIDRFWFHSLYFRDPDGNLLEIATKGPGYAADESPDKLGSKLVLPSWVEPQRKEIENFLKETDSKNSLTWPPKYPKVSTPPEALVVATKVASSRGTASR